MAYIGNEPAENYASFLTQTFSVTATASYTLDHAVSNENDIRLVINNVVQQPGSGKAYTASGTTLTLSEATASTDVMYCVYLGRALQTVNPPNASVGTSQLVDGAVTYAKASGFGKVLQVITATNTVERTTTSNSFVTASNTLTVNITPSSSSNKILLLGSFPMHINGSASLGVHTIYRGSTNLGQTNFGFGYVYSSNANPVSTNANVFLDSPSTTSEITYQVYIRATNNTVFISPNASTSTLTALEIGT